MNKLILTLALGIGASGAQAVEYATVISSTPIVEEVSIPTRRCWNEPVQVEQPRSAGGAVIGAIAGGLLGSTVGRGSGRAAATAAGAITGAVVGDSVANRDSSTTQTVRRCHTTTTREERTTGFDVVYEYAGRQYSTRMNEDPGEEIAINISPAGRPALSATEPAPEDDTEEAEVVEDAPPTEYRTAPPSVVYRNDPWPIYVAPPVVFSWHSWGGWGSSHHYTHPRRWHRR